MLRRSIAAVVLGCFYFCPLDCDNPVLVVDCAAVDTGCMLEKYIKVAHLLRVLQQKGIYTYLVRIQNFLFLFPFDEIYQRLFFFQAEDGIRDSVASRGLGDVYKRQILYKS